MSTQAHTEAERGADRPSRAKGDVDTHTTTGPRVKSTKFVDLNDVRVLEGTPGELISYAQDGSRILVKWDWVVKIPASSGAFVPQYGVEASVPASGVVAI